MKKLYFWGLLVLAFAGCSHGSDPDIFAGRWVSGNGVWRLEAANGSWTQSKSGKELVQGTYISAGGTVIGTIVQVNTALFGEADAWGPFEALTDANKQKMGGSKTRQLPLNGNTFVSAEPDGTPITFTKQ
jgi:hypothetical protein